MKNVNVEPCHEPCQHASPSPCCVSRLSNISPPPIFQLDFSDVLAEPASAHGFDPLWRLSFILFSQTKLWLYRLVSAVLVLPLSLLWAVIFALFTILYVWVVRPVIKLLEVVFAVVKRVSQRH